MNSRLRSKFRQALYCFAVASYLHAAIAEAQNTNILEIFNAEPTIEELKLRAKEGDVVAQRALGHKYLEARDDKAGQAEGVSWLVSAANGGNPDAMFDLGFIYYFGSNGYPSDTKTAIVWFEKAARAGKSDAAVYRARLGPPHEAFVWNLLAAEAGNAEAQNEIGDTYYLGRYVPVDFGEAARWFSVASQQKHPRAMYHLAMMYRFGQGVPQDYRKAFSLFQEAGSLGVSDARLELALALQSGRGTALDREGAFFLLVELAKEGKVDATMELAKCLETGSGTRRRPHAAYSLYNYLTTKYPFYDSARIKRSALASSLSPAEIERGQAATRAMLDSSNVAASIEKLLTN